MKKIAALLALTLLFALSLTGCSSEVSQEEYDALLLENELLRRELAASGNNEYVEPSKPVSVDSLLDDIEHETVI